MFDITRNFFADVAKEMKKVSWPTKEQLRESTIVVIITCVIVSTIVFIIDQAMVQVMALIF
ncbi:MAG: preprotein translocase subunit SecE [bacterium]|nr:preprotein translocase subunit SecE [bacterium]